MLGLGCLASSPLSRLPISLHLTSHTSCKCVACCRVDFIPSRCVVLVPRWLCADVMCVSVLSHVKNRQSRELTPALFAVEQRNKMQDGPGRPAEVSVGCFCSRLLRVDPRCPLAPSHRTCKLRSEFGTFKSHSITPERESCEVSSQRGER